jgi:DNA-binding transcriptional MerR regulator
VSNIASVPTRTSVTIQTELDGANATIKAASEQQAGVMTAEMVRLLYALRDQFNLAAGQAPRVVEIRPGANPALDMALPSPDGQAQREEILPPAEIQSLSERVANMEENGASLKDVADLMNALTGFRDAVGSRVKEIEKRLAELERKASKPAGLPAPDPAQEEMRAELDKLKAEVAALEPIARENSETVQMIKEMINDPTPVLMPEDEK